MEPIYIFIPNCVLQRFSHAGSFVSCLPTQNATNIMLPTQNFNEEKKWVNDFPTAQKRAFVIFPLCQEFFLLLKSMIQQGGMGFVSLLS